MNDELANNISKQAFTTAQTETTLSNLAGQTEIATAQMRRDAEVARIKAEGDSVRLMTQTSANNRAILDSAKAEADAAVVKAKAEAMAIEVRAEAESKSIIIRAQAEQKRAEMLNKTTLGGQIEIYQIYAQMVKDAMSGTSKVVYMPEDAMNNPLSFMNMQGGSIPGLNGAIVKKQ